MKFSIYRPGDDEDTRAYKERLWQIMTPTPFMMAIFGLVMWKLGLKYYAIGMWIFGGYTLGFIILFIALRKYERILSALILYVGMFFSIAATILFGGLLQSGGVALVGLAMYMFSLSFLTRLHTYILFGIYLSFIISIPFIQPYITPVEVIPPRINLILFALHILVIAANIFKTISEYVEEKILMKTREAEQWKELDTLKNQFYNNITHEFRTPLTLILGMSEQIRKKPEELLEKGLHMIQKNGQKLLHLINQMLELSKLQSGKITFYPVQSDIVLFLKYLIEPHTRVAEERDISINLQAPDISVLMDFDPARMESLIGNLVSNAIKNSHAGSDITIEIWKSESTDFESRFAFRIFPRRVMETNHEILLISVRDQGKGISWEQLPRIFERFYRIPDDTYPSVGTGIGLALVADILDFMRGQLYVNSEPGRGSEFCVGLPITNLAPRKEVIQPLPPLSADTHSRVSAPEQDGTPVILIIEDNRDVANYITELLKDTFTTHLAHNGKEGIEKAIKIMPDVIISDILMPEVNGYEVCASLKQDIRTSHIPIILLTARADRDSRIKGIESGADAYLVKPFDSLELETRLRKLWQMRDTLRKKYLLFAYTQSEHPLPDDTEGIFMLRVKEVLQDHIDDESFDVNRLAALFGISRTQLYRKVKALTGHSTSELIQKLRLNRAKELLLNTQLNISEIGYEVGFKDPAYFSRMFSREVGSTPSSFRERSISP